MLSSRLKSPLVLLLLLGALASLPGLGWAPLLDWDEAMQAEVARQILLRGDPFTPMANGQPFTEKPALFFLETAAFFRALGVSETAARLPSAVNGLAFLAGLYWLGRRLVDARFACAAAAMYATALLPLVLSRAAVLEHTFNVLMGAAALLLLAYDTEYGAARDAGGPRRRYWALLLGAALALGLAVLTKGPVGGAIPLVAYGSAKLARRRPRIHPGHFLVCGAVALAVAGSWYVGNFLAAGGGFVREFAVFMGLLFSRPLEGHGGPFYYHVAVGLVGFFPWTPLLLLYALPAVRRAVWAQPNTRALAALALGWTGFVLVVFSLVQTKLPHYSSSMYLPLALLAALAARAALAAGGLPAWLRVVFGAYGAALGALLAALPYASATLAAQAGVVLEHPPVPSPWAFLPGAALAVGTVAAAILARRESAGRALVAAALACALFAVGLWRFQLPLIAQYNQGPEIALMEEAYAQGGDLALYRHASYAVLFYGHKDVEVLHNYKFKGDPAWLDRMGERPRFVITPVQEEGRLLAEHPGLRRVRQTGPMVLYRQAPAGR